MLARTRALVPCLVLALACLALVHAEQPEEKAKRQKASWGYQRAHQRGDLPELPEYRSPQGKEWTNSVAICAITKDENTTDVREWVLYHKCVPFYGFLCVAHFS